MRDRPRRGEKRKASGDSGPPSKFQATSKDTQGAGPSRSASRSQEVTYEEYVARLAILVVMRLMAIRREEPLKELQFQLSNKKEDAAPFGDLILDLQWQDDFNNEKKITYFVQVKLETHTQPTTTKKLNQRVKALEKTNRQTYKDLKKFKKIAIDKQKEYCLILHTNGSFLPKESVAKKDPDFAFENIFKTPKGEVISIGPEDSKVYRLFKGIDNTDLRRFRVFKEQESISDSLLSEEIQKSCNNNSQNPAQVLEKLLSFFSDWCKVKGSDPVSEITPTIQNILGFSS